MFYFRLKYLANLKLKIGDMLLSLMKNLKIFYCARNPRFRIPASSSMCACFFFCREYGYFCGIKMDYTFSHTVFDVFLLVVDTGLLQKIFLIPWCFTLSVPFLLMFLALTDFPQRLLLMLVFTAYSYMLINWIVPSLLENRPFCRVVSKGLAGSE